MSEGPNRLLTGYYLLNFETLLGEVRARYGDLLHGAEHRRLEAFLALPLDARRLYVRMLTRKGPWFRSDSLDYGEITSVPDALETLQQCGFCESSATIQDLLPLLLREDLGALLQGFGIPFVKHLRRDALLQRLLEEAEAAVLLAELRARLRPVKPLHTEFWALLAFLFFGNGEQGLSSFVLADTGRIRYEAYRLDTEQRLFQSRQEVDFLLSLQSMREAFEEAVRADRPDRMGALGEALLAMDLHPGVRQQRRYHRLLNEMGRAWERRREPVLALACYRRSPLPPARERIVRLTLEAPQACDLALQMAQAPVDLSEERFARSFLQRQARRVPAAAAWLGEQPPPEPLPEHCLVLPRQPSVERAALEAARREGWEGFFAENILWNALFGLVFWEELFTPVPGAFQHRFQSAPLDLGHPDFFARRREALEHRLEELQDRDALHRRVLATADQKWGIANAFLTWRHLSRGMLQAAVERVPPPVLTSVLRTMAQSPTVFSSGFPDLFLFHTQRPGWALWEVKGPGDTLRPEQERWLQQFRRLGCEVRVARVKWT